MAATTRLEQDALERIERAVRPYTMVAPANLASTLRLTVGVISEDLPGVLVECGAWRGGCSAAMLLAQREAFGQVVRPAWLLDSFEGLPPAMEQKDGPLAIAYQRQEYGEYVDNCAASIEEAHATMRAFDFEEGRDYHLVRGWFEQTAPELSTTLRKNQQSIVLLRLDGDWYESTLQCLEALEPLLTPEGALVLDDYYWWDGCARATHDYLSRHDLPYRIQSMPQFLGAYLLKRAARTADSSYLATMETSQFVDFASRPYGQGKEIEAQRSEIERLKKALRESQAGADRQQDIITAQVAEIERLNSIVQQGFLEGR